jgi:3-methylcrotonyl-CoA carboxylase alpha subunit
MITRQDLVEWQLRVASGEVLPLRQEELKIHGHAFEARVYAEDPDNDFLPATGTLNLLQPPLESEFVRVDTGVVQGDEVSVYYDPMIAKLIVWDENRDKALARLSKALSEYHIDGVTTNIDFLYNLANCQAFKNTDIDTGFIEKHHSEIFLQDKRDIEPLLPIAALYLMLNRQIERNTANQDLYSPWSANNNWRANETHSQLLTLMIHDQAHVLQVQQMGLGKSLNFVISAGENSYNCSGEVTGNQLIATINGHKSKASIVAHEQGYSLFTQGKALKFSQLLADFGISDDTENSAGFIAPMNGTIVTLLVEPGQLVEKNQALMIMEAMKMEHVLKAPAGGKVVEFYYQVGELVDGGAELLSFAPNEEEAEK